MRTSLNDIRQTEEYLFGQLDPQESLLFKAKLLISPLFRMNLHFQKKAYAVIKMYHRKELKEEVKEVHQRLFDDPAKEAFQKNIHQLFKH